MCVYVCAYYPFIFFFVFRALVYVEADAANYITEREDGSKRTSLSLIQKEFNLLRNPKSDETHNSETHNTETSE